MLYVSIIIPAFNEEKNINFLLRSLLKQIERGFRVREIVVISDGSTDGTAKEALRNRNKKVRVVKYGKRLGKIQRLSQYFENFKGNILVQLDADIILSNKYVLYHLIAPFGKDLKVDLVCGSNTPLKPKRFMEKIAYFGVDLWIDARKSLGKKAERYNCTGQIRAFSRNYLNGFRFPKDIISGEDIYSFYYAKNNNLNVIYTKKAKVHYRLPSTLSDYVKQMRRFILSSLDIKKFFPRPLIIHYEVITLPIKLKSLLKIHSKYPILIVFFYLLLQLISTIQARLYKKRKVWDIAKTSKKLK